MRFMSVISRCFAVAALGNSFTVVSQASAETVKRATTQASQRTAILSALRPRATRDLGAPVEFVVSQYRQRANLAFVSVTPQRPGGRAIELPRTPVGKDGAAAQMDGAVIQAFFKRTNGVWRVDLYAIGATDVWYGDPLICATYASVMTPNLCTFEPISK